MSAFQVRAIPEVRADPKHERLGIDDGSFLSETARLATSTVDTLSALVTKVVSQAVNGGDKSACTILVIGAIRRYADNPQLWGDGVFFPCLRVLQKAVDHNWIAGSWHQSGKDSLFANLTADQSRAVLAAMFRVRHIDYQSEQILKEIGLTRHQMVLDWFGQRVEIARQESSLEFESVPFSFQFFHEALQPHPRDVLASVRQWFDRDDSAPSWDATHFLSKIYPDLQEPLPSILLDLVHSANAADLAFLASSLRGFNGRPELIPILGAMLASETASDDTEGQVLEVLLETGVMTGEFGGAQTYQAKVELLEPWLDDKNTRVAKFAAREIASLRNRVAAENRRAQEQIAMRRLQHGKPGYSVRPAMSLVGSVIRSITRRWSRSSGCTGRR